jgi:YVTN family beta-propeller protein
MNLRSHLRLGLALVLLVAAGTCEVMRESRPTILRPGVHLYAYVANRGDGTVTAVDLVKLAPVATISVGAAPAALHAHPTRREIWGVSTGAGSAWVIDAPSGRVQHIPVCAQPVSLDFSPDGSRAYVACAGSDTLVAIDCASRRVLVRGRTGRQPWVVRASRNGKWVLTANREDSTVTVFNAANLDVVATLPVAPQPDRMVLRLDPPELLARLATGGRTNALLLKPDGGEVYVLSPDTHGLTVINTWTNEVGDFLLLGANPVAGVVTGDGGLLYACDAAAGRVAVVNLSYRELLGSAPTGQGPVACALGLEERLLLAVDAESGDLAVIAREGPHLVTLVPVGKQPDSLAVKLF